MLTLYAFGPGFGLPDPSPFVTKAEVLLKMAGVPYRKDTTGFRKAPKGKLPYIDDDGVLVADSTFIRLYLQRRYDVDFDAGLSPAERGVAWAFEKMCEDHLYWALVHARFMDDANFDAGPRRFFDGAPAVIRPLVVAMVKRQVRRSLWGHGMGRHSEEEIAQLAVRDLAAIADFLADKPYLMGARPCGADAAVFAFVAACFPARFKTPIRVAAELQPGLVAYRDRMLQQYYPELAPAKGKAA
ncbi:MAG: glutathione S-transferase family protein [Hyphomicrobium sp.]|uniref:glutathione S-transferase family protein n=1 Tax=Hyphomicrobium sp. TaxID=82 RepID=UPI00132B7DE2|nr:glutathione S-transferase family protein [Hyphomicrobium sp.]KAB2941035.1 MAG: glutathione S-transferase family protein [Hyphomicrobium sp.]MBZ0210923.1 glutathione S-transferase family protein [Hyphomicrobium sp.]